MSRSAATYLYCVVRNPGPPETGDVPDGLPGLSAPRILPVGDGLWLVAADAPLPRYDAESIREHLQNLDWVSKRALAHESMVEHFGRIGTVVPMKLFTLFASDERALAHVRSDRDRLDRILARIGGCREWGVLVRFDEERARSVESARMATNGDGKTSGTAFLMRKKQEKDAARNLLGELRPEMDAAFSDLAGSASESRRREPAAPALLLDGAFLVRDGAAAEFESIVARWASRFAERACEVTLTGPWPPYNFLDDAP